MFMDLSKGFDSISHKRFIAKINAYGFSKNFLVFFLFILKTKKARRLNN